jgi:signal transduction histidine kinase
VRAALPDLAGPQVQRLLDAVLDVASDLSLPDVLRRIVDSSVQLAGARYGALGVLDEDGSGFADFLFTGVDDTTSARIGRHPTGRGVLGLLIAQPEPVRLPDVRLHPQSYGIPPGHPPMHSFLGVPVRVGDGVFGNLYLAEKIDEPQFTARDEQIVVALAAAAGVAIEKARLYSDTMCRERWLEAANAVLPALLDERGPDAVLREVARHALTAATGTMAAVALPADGGRMTVVVTVGEHADRAVGQALPGRHRAVADVIAGRGAVRLQDADLLHALAPDARDGGPEWILLAPLSLGSDPLGVLLVSAAHPFGEEDRRSAEVFGRHAALALEVARGHEDQQRLALYEDRDRIARDLHDHVIQRLFATGLSMQGLRKLTTQPGIAERLGGYVEELDHTIRDIRRAIFALHEAAEPNAPASLPAQLLRIAQEASAALPVEPRMTFTGPIETSVPDDVRDDAVATLREALSNVARHAAAGRVDVQVICDPALGQLELRVRDDGRGMGSGPPRGRGLANMGDRARRWGGTFVARTCADGGTEVRWSVPLRRAPETGS